jgi:hypothetical protein
MTGGSADLSGVLVKIDRARTHLDDFDRRARRVEEACRKAIVRERDEQRSEYVFRFNRVPAISAVLGAIIGDAIHNLRVSLDHLAWQLVIATGGTPSNATTFPIHEVPPRPIATVVAVPRSILVSQTNCGKSSMKYSLTSERSRPTTTLPSSTGLTSATSTVNCLSPLSASSPSLGGAKLDRPDSIPVPMMMAQRYVGSPTPARTAGMTSIPSWPSRYASMNQRRDRGA